MQNCQKYIFKIFVIIALTCVLVSCKKIEKNDVYESLNNISSNVENINVPEIDKRMIDKQTAFSLKIFETLINIKDFSEQNVKSIPKYYNWTGLKTDYFEYISEEQFIIDETENKKEMPKHGRLITLDKDILKVYEENTAEETFYIIIYNYQKENEYAMTEFVTDKYKIQYDISKKDKDTININIGYIEELGDM